MEQLDFFAEPGEPRYLSNELFDYRSGIFNKSESRFFLEKFIKEVAWDQKSVLMYGKKVITPRLTAWFGDPGTDYSISGDGSEIFPWTKELLIIREKVESLAGISFNSVLLNYYRDGNDSVSWHNDGDGIPGRNLIVASVSFGQERNFEIRSKTDHSRKFSVMLEDGSYFLMKGDFQENWQHRIAKLATLMRERVNLTFRVMPSKSS